MSLVSFHDKGVDYYNVCGITDAAKVGNLVGSKQFSIILRL